MNARFHERAAGIAICLYTAWNARDLFSAWRHAPYDRMDALAFAVWIVPAFVCLIRGTEAGFPRLIAGLLLSLAGSLVDLNFLKQAALACALAGFARSGPASWFWLACSVSWMPVLGWCASAAGPFPVQILRILLAAAGTACLLTRKS